jgi:hypothetical protein
MRSVRPSRIVAAGLALAGLLANCGGRPSAEDRIRSLIKDAVTRAEKGDVAGLVELLAPDFEDFQGRDATGTGRLVREYLDQYRGVVVHLLGVRIGEIGADSTATLECEVVLSHGAAEVLRRLIRVVGEYYRFRVEVRRAGAAEWRITYAAWESIGLDGLFPESRHILQKLFPGL